VLSTVDKRMFTFAYIVESRLMLSSMFCFLFRQSRSKSAARNTDGASDRQPRFKRIDVNYEYFDGGNHFCRCCNVFSINIFEHCQHLISSSHQQVAYVVLFCFHVCCAFTVEDTTAVYRIMDSVIWSE